MRKNDWLPVVAFVMTVALFALGVGAGIHYDRSVWTVPYDTVCEQWTLTVPGSTAYYIAQDTLTSDNYYKVVLVDPVYKPARFINTDATEAESIKFFYGTSGFDKNRGTYAWALAAASAGTLSFGFDTVIDSFVLYFANAANDTGEITIDEGYFRQ